VIQSPFFYLEGACFGRLSIHVLGLVRVSERFAADER